MKIDIGNLVYYIVYVIGVFMFLWNMSHTILGLITTSLVLIAFSVTICVNDMLISKVFKEG